MHWGVIIPKLEMRNMNVRCEAGSKLCGWECLLSGHHTALPPRKSEQLRIMTDLRLYGLASVLSKDLLWSWVSTVKTP